MSEKKQDLSKLSPTVALNDNEAVGVSDDDGVFLVRDDDGNGNPAVYLAWPYAVAPELLNLLTIAIDWIEHPIIAETQEGNEPLWDFIKSVRTVIAQATGSAE